MIANIQRNKDLIICGYYFCLEISRCNILNKISIKGDFPCSV